MHNCIIEEICSFHFPGIINIVYSWSQEMVAITTMEKLKIASFMTCYGVLGQAVLFCVVSVCKLSSTKQYLYNALRLLVLIIYLTPMFQDSLLT